MKNIREANFTAIAVKFALNPIDTIVKENSYHKGIYTKIAQIGLAQNSKL